MIKRIAGFVVAGACLLGTAHAADAAPAPATSAAPVTLASDHPDSYTVQPGDTLWGIAEKFLKNPWQWPEVWHVNEQVANPHRIYPGNVIRLLWRDGKPMLVMGNETLGGNAAAEVIDANTVKLKPRIRDMELATSIPAIPLRAIEVFLTDNRVVALDDLNAAPYIIAGPEGRVVMGAGDTIYARSREAKWNESLREFGIFRPGQAYLDPRSKEVLGYEAVMVGGARLLESSAAVGTLRITRSEEDARIDDRLLAGETATVQSTFYPRAGKPNLGAEIIRIFGSLGHAGRNDVVVINRGKREGVDVGQVFAVLQRGETVRDRRAGELVTLPPTRAGLMIVFRTFDKVSYGLITRSTRPIRQGDLLDEPRVDVD